MIAMFLDSAVDVSTDYESRTIHAWKWIWRVSLIPNWISNKKAVLSQRWPRDAPTKVNKQPHLHLRPPDSRLTQFNQTLWTWVWNEHFLPQISPCSLGVDGWPLGYEEQSCWANCSCNWFPRFSTYVVMFHQRHRRTDGQTDDMRSQDRALHYSASRGRNLGGRLTNTCYLLKLSSCTRSLDVQPLWQRLTINISISTNRSTRLSGGGNVVR